MSESALALTKQVQSTINDIENMRFGETDNFGPFSEGEMDDEGNFTIEWTNLAIQVEHLKEALAKFKESYG